MLMNPLAVSGVVVGVPLTRVAVPIMLRAMRGVVENPSGHPRGYRASTERRNL
jgi:hypothetical protein